MTYKYVDAFGRLVRPRYAPPPGSFPEERERAAELARRAAEDSDRRERVARAEKARQEAARQEYETKIAALQKERRDEDFARLCDAYRRRFLASEPTATEADFAKAWPGLLAEHRRRSALGEPTPDVAGRVTAEDEAAHILQTNRRL